MIRHLTLLLTAALLVFSLTACGCSAKDSGTADHNAVTDTQSSTAQDSASPNTGTSNGESGAGTGTADTAPTPNGSETAPDGQTAVGDAVEDAVDGVRDAVKSGARNAEDLLNGVSRRTGGTGFRQMVRNGRVHDTDGDLTDGENSRSDGGLF